MSAKKEIYLRNTIFGVSDSLVSTVGLLSGIDVSGTSRQIILLTGVVYAFVEAFSMAIGSFLSEQSAEEYETGGEVDGGEPLVAGIVMFISFVVASFVPILPYLLFDLSIALWISISLSVAALFILGLVSARLVRVKMMNHATKMALLGGTAIIIGVIVGKLIK
ncbi:MAG: VIT1/CCC1 transporter family protein [Patescibacteria group bacterium]|nr:VIT1/CCC1 transporter family protein [Patescibacteria group bacterium]MCL5224220.1 VIT1/CCC1 transporter family protein [Patescibacteria group bacterium]